MTAPRSRWLERLASSLVVEGLSAPARQAAQLRRFMRALVGCIGNRGDDGTFNFQKESLMQRPVFILVGLSE